MSDRRLTLDIVAAYHAGLISGEEARKLVGLEGPPPNGCDDDDEPQLLNPSRTTGGAIGQADRLRLLNPVRVPHAPTTAIP